MAHKKNAEKEEFTIRENNNEPDANIKRRENSDKLPQIKQKNELPASTRPVLSPRGCLLPSPIEQSALQMFQSLSQSLPVPRWVF